MSKQNEVDLSELLSVIETENKDLIHSYLKLHDIEYNFAKDREQIDTKELVSYKKLLGHLVDELLPKQLSGFYLGFKLKDQANTQFDLLKVSKDTVLNFEFKSDTPNKLISEQAAEHYRFLNMKFSRVIVLEHLVSSDELFLYNPNSKQMEPMSYNNLHRLIPDESTGISPLENMTRSDFLVAPYNEVQKFLNASYELTTPQKNIKDKILLQNLKFTVIEGGPGSGKTLLLIDIIREYRQRNLKVGMVMGAKTSSGQKQLMESLGVSLYWYYELANLTPLLKKDILVFDEAQRIPGNLIDEALALPNNVSKIFSIDKEQIVHPEEKNRDIQNKLENSIPDSNIFHLKKSIRINPELSDFYKRLLDKKARSSFHNFENVSIRHFQNRNTACQYINEQCEKGVVVVESDEYTTKKTFTKTRLKKYPQSKNVKDVIGQEFKNVMLIFGEYVSYDSEGKLKVNSPEYYPYIDEKMIFQAITRASHSVEILIINNINLYLDLQDILTRSRDTPKKRNTKIDELTSQIKSLKEELAIAQDKIKSLSQNSLQEIE